MKGSKGLRTVRIVAPLVACAVLGIAVSAALGAAGPLGITTTSGSSSSGDSTSTDTTGTSSTSSLCATTGAEAITAGYADGDVTVAGSGFSDVCDLSVDTTGPAGGAESGSVTTGLDGSFSYTAPLSGPAGTYQVDANDMSGTTLVSATFELGLAGATTSLLVKLASGLSSDEQAAVIARDGGTETSTIAPLRLHIISVPTNDASATLANYQSDSDVVSAELDMTRTAGGEPSDPGYSTQWALSKIGWPDVYRSVDPQGSAKLAVLDTGVSSADGDLNVGAGWSAFGANPASDPDGHGTWVASIAAAAADNGKGIAGVDYAKDTTIEPVQVLDSSGVGQDSDIVQGVVWAAEHGADVILMSFSNPGYSPALQDAIDYAWQQGAVVVAATGNDSSSTATFPAGDAKVMGVSATDQSDALSSTSNYGADTFIAAPGVDVTADNADGSAASITGTSASAALVAGAAALLKANDPSASNGVIVGRLARNADVAGTVDQTGNGRLNLSRAIADASTDPVTPAGAPPVGDGGPLVGPYSAASACTSTGGGGNWNVAATWNCGRVPGNTDTAVISASNPVTVNSAIGSSPATITVSASASLTVSAGSVSTSTGGITITGALSVSGGTLSSATDIAMNGALNLSGGTVTATGNMLPQAAASWTVSGGTLQIGGDLRFNGATAISNWNSGISANPTGTVEFTTVTAGTTTSQFLNLPATGTLQFPNLKVSGANDPNFGRVSGWTISVAGDYTNNNTAPTPALPTTVVFGGTAATQTIGGTQPTTFNNLTVNKTSGEVALAQNTTALAAVKLTSGKITTGVNTLIAGIGAYAPAVTVATAMTSSTTTLKTNIALPAQAGDIVRIDDEWMTVQSGGGTTTLTVNRAFAGTTAVAHGVGAAIERVGYTAGLTSAGYIVGSYRRPIPIGTNVARTFEVGTATQFTPVTLSFASVSTAGSVTVKAVDGDHADTTANASGIDPGKSVNENWVVTNGGVGFTNAGATFNFTSALLDAGADTSAFVVRKKDGSTWTSPTVGTRTSTSTQATGIASFSEFAVGETAATNHAPTANAGGPYSGDEGLAIQLDGSGSSDPDAGDTLTYAWSAPAGCTLSSATAQKPTVTCSDNGSYTVSLTVTDNHLASSSASNATVTVANVAPTANFTASSPVNEGSPTTLTFSSPSDPSSVDTSAGFHYAFACATGAPTFVTTWGTLGTGDGQFAYPSAVAVTSTGTVYVADTSNSRVEKFDANGTFLGKWGSAGAADGQFSGPFGIAVASDGSVYVADTSNNRIEKFDAGGSFLAKWGSAGTSNGQFSSPTGVAVGSDGSVYVADSGNNRIQKFTSSGTYLAQWGSAGSGDGQFSQPWAVAVSTGGSVYVADTHNYRIEKFDSNGTFLGKWGSPGSGNGQFLSSIAQGVAVGPDGNVFATDRDNGRTQEFDANGSFITAWGSFGSGSQQFQYPQGLAVASTGAVYVADTHNQRIQEYTTAPLTGATYANSGTATAASCTYADDATYTVTGRIIDKDGGYTEYTAQVTVNNVAPTVTAPSNQATTAGYSASLNLGSFSDPGVNDNPWAVDVDWGDGSTHTTFNSATQGSLGSQSHAYATSGTKTVTVKVTDKDGGSGSATFSVTVSKRTTSTAISCSPGSVTISQGSTCTATVSDTDSGTKSAPAGSVTLTTSGSGSFSPSATCTLSPATGSTSTCAVTYTPSASGTHTIKGDYTASGSVHANSSDGTGFPLTVNKRGTSTAISCSPSSVAISQGSTCTATVSDTDSGTKSTPAGSVTLTTTSSGSFSPSATCTLSAATSSTSTCAVTYTPSVLGTGTHTIKGDYTASGSTDANSSDATGFALTVTKRATSTVVSCSPSSVAINQGSTCTATVTDTDNGTKSSPGGTATFNNGGAPGAFSPGGTCTLSADTSSTSKCSVTYTPSGLGAAASPVSAGGFHTCAVKTDGTLACWGYNVYGEASVPAGLGAVGAVSAGSYHTCALKTDGTLACWGYNGDGETSVPAGLGTVSAVNAGLYHTCAVKTDGTLACWGYNNYGQTSVPAGLGPVSAVSAGGFHTCALKTDATLACWGYNADGETSVPAGLGPVSAVSAGGFHTCALKTDRTLVCWGYNGYGETSVPAGLGAVSAVSTGVYHTCALKTDGTLACWGYNDYGQTSVPAGLGSVSAVSAGAYHTCAVKTDGTLACWGRNSEDQTSVPAGLVVPTGGHVVEASYAANDVHADSSDATGFALTVTKRSTSTSISCAPSSVAINQGSTCTATVSDTDSGTKSFPQGSVSFANGAASGSFSGGGSCALGQVGSTSTSSCSVTYMPSASGAPTITGSYTASDSTHAGSSDATGSTLSVSKRSTSTVVSCDSPVAIDQGSTCTAVVSDTAAGTASMPSGTVSFTAGGAGVSPTSPSCTLSSGSCSVTLTGGSAGAITVSGSYGGDSTHDTSAGGTSVTVSKRATSTAISCSPASVAISQGSTCTATVTDVDLGTKAAPAGSVTLTTNSSGGFSPSATCTLSTATSSTSTCAVTYTASALGSGTHTIKGGYTASGSVYANSSDGTGFALSVALRSTSTVVSCDSPVAIDQGSTCTAVVSDTAAGSASMPSGTVSFTAGGAGVSPTSPSCTLSSGSCSVTLTGGSAGTITVSGSYGGDSTHGTSAGGTSVTVSKRATSTAISCSPASVAISQGSTCTATVSDADLGTKAAPAGSVTLTTNASGAFSPGATCTLSTATSSTSTCAVTYTPSASGTHTIKGDYTASGSVYSNSSDTTGFALTVNKRTTSTSVSCAPGSVAINQGSTCTATVTDTAAGGASAPAGSVTLTTNSSGGFSPSATCTLSAASNSSSTCAVTYTPSALGTGTHTIKGDYTASGTTHANSSDSTGFALTVSKRSTSTSISCSPSSVAINQGSTCTATVSDTGSGAKSYPQGSVSFSKGAASGSFSGGGTCTLAQVDSTTTSSCSVTYTPSALGTGTHTITGNYTASDGIHADSSDATGSALTVTKRTTSTSVSCAPRSVPINDSSTCTATVSDTDSGTKSYPQGSVAFSNGTASGTFTPSATCTLSQVGSTTDSSCSVTYKPTAYNGGTHTITGSYTATGIHANSSDGSGGGTPAYYPSGPQTNVAKNALAGWRQCWRSTYADSGGAANYIPTVLANCSGNYLLLASGPVASANFDVLAAGPRADVLYDTGSGDYTTTHTANGVAWYYNTNWSWGFAAAGDAVYKFQCDEEGSAYINPTDDPTRRLCWHTLSNYVAYGWRSGANTGLNGDSSFERMIYVPQPGFALTVTKRTTSTSVSCTPASVAVNQSSTCTATVSDTDSGTKSWPQGSVSFGNGGASGSFGSPSCALSEVGSGTTSSCSVTYTPSGLSGGTHSISGSYSASDAIHGDSSDSTDFALTVTNRTTSTAVSCSPAWVPIADSSSCTATVSDTDSGTKSFPTGSISFSNGGASGSFGAGGSCTLSQIGSTTTSSCSVSYTPSAYSGGTHTIKASYTANDDHANSSDGTGFALTVTKRTTSTSVSCSPSSIPIADSSTCTATVSDTGSGTKSFPAGSISFNNGGAPGSFGAGGTCTLAQVPSTTTSSCSVSYTPSAFNGGTHTIKASYTANDTHADSSDGTGFPLAVTKRTTSTSVSCAPASVPINDNSSCTATVSDTDSETKSFPAGSVSFNSGAASGSFSGGGSCILSQVASTTTSSCSVSYTPSAYNAGTHTIKASYTANDTHADSSDGTGFALTVTKRLTSTSVACSPASVAINQGSTCTATVSDTDSGAKWSPSGSVAFSNGGSAGSFSAAGTCTLTADTSSTSKCSVTYTPSGLGSGTHTIKGGYSAGDGIHADSSDSTGFALGVTKRTTSTSVSCAPASVPINADTTCTATVTDTDLGTPSSPPGTVTLGNGGASGAFSPSATCTLGPAASSTSSCSVTYTPSAYNGGTHTISGSYSPGDAIHAGSSTLTGFGLTVTKRTTSTSVICVPSSVAINQGSTCTATVSDTDTGTKSPPGGSVSFSSNSAGGFGPGTSCTLAADTGPTSKCSVTYTPSTLGTGTHSISGSYTADDDLHANGSTASAFALGVTKRKTSTSVSCAPSPIPINGSSSCTATVSDTDAGAPSYPQGSVSFAKGGTAAGSFSGGGTCTLAEVGSTSTSSCSVTYTPTNYNGGSHTITGSYAASDPIHANSADSTGFALIVTKRTTSTSVSCAPSSVAINQGSTCTATVTDTDTGANGIPGGSVTFNNGMAPGAFTPSATCNLSPDTGAASKCSVTYTPSALGTGTHSISGSYTANDYVHAGSTTASSFALGVTKRLTSTSVSCSPSPVAINQSSTCTATVSDTDAPAKSWPQGTVTFGNSSASGSFGSPTCNLAQVGTGTTSTCSVAYTPSGLSGGTHTITGNYSAGDGIHADSSTLTGFALGVKTRTTSTSVSCSPASVPINADTTCTATVTDTDLGTPSSPPGTVTLGNGGASGTFSTSATCTLAPDTSSTSKCSVTYTPLGNDGTHTISGSYSPGDAIHAGSSTTTGFPLGVTKRTTSTSVTCAPSPVAINQGSTCTATVSDTDTAPKSVPTGSVTFSSGGPGGFTPSASCTLATDTGPTSKCSVTYTPWALGTGTHSIGGSYTANDYIHAGSTAGGFALGVTKRKTSTSVSCSPSSIPINDSSSCTATVSDTDAGAASYPQGSVSFAKGGSAAGSFSGGGSCTLSQLDATTSSCSVTYTPTNYNGGTHTITGSYTASDPIHANSADSTGYPLTATKRTTSTALSCETPRLTGQPSKCTVTVSDTDTGTKSWPQGSVSFSKAAGDSGSFSGAGSCTLAQVGSGTTSSCYVNYTPNTATTHTINASYAANDAIHANSSTQTGSAIIVNKAATSTAVTSSLTPSTFGQSVTFTATVSPVSPGGGTPQGTVQFRIDGSDVGTPQTLDSSGKATYSTSNLTVPSHSVSAVYAGNDNYTGSTAPAITQTVNVLATSTSVTLTSPVQYSDPVPGLKATITPATAGGQDVSGGTVKFFANNGITNVQFAQAPVVVSGGIATATPGAVQPSPLLNAGGYKVTAVFTSSNPNFGSSQSATSSNNLTVTPEDARATYTGATLASTGSVNSTSANVTFAATVQDITAADPTLSPPNPDTYGGDIKTATVSFWDVTTSTSPSFLCSAPAGYASSADTLTGTVTCNANLTANSTTGGTPYNVRVVVGNSTSLTTPSGNYVNPSNDGDDVVNVYIPQSNFITGGGYLKLTSSSGLYPGQAGTKNNFGFNVKYNKSGTNLQGNINTIVRNNGRVYQIKGNSMTSLVTKVCTISGCPTTSSPSTAVFNGKASIQDITNPLAPISIDGNATLQVTMTDKGEPGSNDSIAITVWNKAGGLWFSSNWTGTKTIEQLLGGGNLSVH